MAKSMLSFIQYQEYVKEAGYFVIPFGALENWRATGDAPDVVKACTHDLWQAENDRNPDKFPEWHGRQWPGNCHIAKRYAVHFDVEWDPEAVWLTAPRTKKVDIVFHMPIRRSVRPAIEWAHILKVFRQLNYSVLILGGRDDIEEWRFYAGRIPRLAPDTLLQSADYINSAKLFIGGASSCNTIAEGLKKHRIVELADDCDDTYPYGDTGQCANGMSLGDIVEKAQVILDG